MSAVDPLSLAVGAALIAAGFAAGRFRRPTMSAPAEEPQTEPICACTHSLADHSPKTNRCNGETKRPVHHAGYFSHNTWVSCTCMQYVGPVPLSQVWVPPISNERAS